MVRIIGVVYLDANGPRVFGSFEDFLGNAIARQHTQANRQRMLQVQQVMETGDRTIALMYNVSSAQTKDLCNLFGSTAAALHELALRPNLRNLLFSPAVSCTLHILSHADTTKHQLVITFIGQESQMFEVKWGGPRNIFLFRSTFGPPPVPVPRVLPQARDEE